MSLHFVAKGGDDLVPYPNIADELASVAVIDSESVGEGSGNPSPHPLGGEQALGAVEAKDYGDGYIGRVPIALHMLHNLTADGRHLMEVAQLWAEKLS